MTSAKATFQRWCRPKRNAIGYPYPETAAGLRLFAISKAVQRVELVYVSRLVHSQHPIQ